MLPLATENPTTAHNVPNFNKTLTNETQQTLAPSGEAEIVRFLDSTIRPVLIVIGTIGNGLSFYIIRQGSLRKMSTCFYLSILALADTSKCVVFLYVNQ